MLKTRWRLSAHTASPVWCGLGPPRHGGDTAWRRQHRGVGTVQLVWYSQFLLSLAENKKWLVQHLLQVRGKMSPTRRASAAQRGSPKNKKNNSPNPNKAKLLSSSHPALHHPHNSNLTPHLQFLPLLTPKWQSQACLHQFLWWSDKAPGRAQILFGSESWRTTQFSTQKRKVKSNLNC